MTLEEAKEAAAEMAAEKGALLGRLLMTEAAIEEGAWFLEYEDAADPSNWVWYFLLGRAHERPIMVDGRAVDPATAALLNYFASLRRSPPPA